jgi:hypothetical protein
VTSVERTLALICEQGQRFREAWGVYLRGHIAERRDPPDVRNAETHYRAAVAIASELDMRPVQAHCLYGLARLRRRAGDYAKTQEHLTTATTMCRDMGMTSWLEKAEAALSEMKAMPAPIADPDLDRPRCQ